MRKAFNIIGLALALLLAFSSCQKAPLLTFNGQKSFTFKDTGGSETITFSCNRAWTAKSSESWLTVSPARGDANEEGVRVTITCAANTTYDPRNATVSIMSEGLTETISVSQDTNYGLMSEPTAFTLTNAAQTIDVEVKANVEYSVVIDDACKDWISQAGTKALASTKLSFNIAANESYDDREGKITISQKGSATSVQPQVITVKQSQTNGMFITTPEYALSNESHDLTIEVKANVSYEVTPEVDWIKYEASSTKALSATTFTLKVNKNETYDQRVGTVKVKGGGLEGVITITQAENLGLFVSPTEVQISKDAQEVEVEVQANVEYDIIVPEEAKGMITTIKKQGGGDTKSLSATKYLFGVSENAQYVGRVTSITFKQKDGSLSGTFKISQEQRDTLGIASQKDSLSYDELEGKLIVAANVEYHISQSEDVDWISISEPKKIDEKEGVDFFEYTFTIKSRNISLSPRRTSFSVSSEGIDTKLTYVIVQGPVPVPEGAVAGIFSVSATKKIFFSKGNLYYDGNSFRFEENQYDFQSTWNTSHVSHFFWSNDARVAYSDNYNAAKITYGITPTVNDVFFTNATVETANSDFTVNGITGKYRTLSSDEWQYLLGTSTERDGKYRRLVTVCGKTNCVVIAPDNFTGTIESIYDAAAWEIAKDAGLVCLPAAGFRDGSIFCDVGYTGLCWSSSASDGDFAYRVYFDCSGILSSCSLYYRYHADSVRLITEAPAE